MDRSASVTAEGGDMLLISVRLCDRHRLGVPIDPRALASSAEGIHLFVVDVELASAHRVTLQSTHRSQDLLWPLQVASALRPQGQNQRQP